MLSVRPVAIAAKPKRAAGVEDDEALDELLLDDELELLSSLSSPPQDTRPTPIKVAIAAPKPPLIKLRRCCWRASRTDAKVGLVEKLERGSSPLLSMASGWCLSVMQYLHANRRSLLELLEPLIKREIYGSPKTE